MLAVLLVVCTVLFVLARVLAILPKVNPPVHTKISSKTSIMVVLGSGGHTMEMMRLLSGLSAKHYTPRMYVISDTDKMSENKARQFERTMDTVEGQDWTVARIPRSREVRQSWLTTIFYTIKSLLFCVPLVLRNLPDVILCNGPGTCVPVCLISYIPRFLGIKTIRVVYAESICRVHSLSLAGRLLYRLCDLFVVQWPTLQEKYPRAIYAGRFM